MAQLCHSRLPPLDNTPLLRRFG